MTETLVIRLRAAEDAPASWLIVDGTGARSGPVQSGPVADALPQAQGRRVVLLLPASEVTLAEPELPVRGAARLAQAVPFALEEQVASDLEALHFAVGTRRTGAVGTPVAIVSRALIERWLGTCESAGLHPSAAYVESSAVPASPNVCTLLLDESTLHVHRGDGVPYAVDAQSLPVALSLALGPVAEPGEHVVFYASPAEYEAHRDTIEGLRARTATLQVKLLPDGPLPLMAAQLHTADPINLLQGPLAPPSSLGHQFRAWRVPIGIAAGTVLVYLVAQAASLWQLHRAEKQLDAQISQVVGHVLPGQKIIDARAQVQGILQRQAGGGGALLPAVSLLAQAVAAAPTTRLESISYRGNAIEMRVTAPTIEALDGIKQAMGRNGAAVELLSAQPRGQIIEGRLSIKFGAA